LKDNELPDVNSTNIEKRAKWGLKTHDGHSLSIQEDKFITLYLEYGDEGKAAQEAGYILRSTIKNKEGGYKTKGRKLLELDYIQREIEYRLTQFKNEHIADAQEVMMYFTAVMRGEVKDQFDLDPPLGERTSAAKELAKRVIDAPQNKGGDNELHVVIEHKKREE
jgi:phage terminase small subunit